MSSGSSRGTFQGKEGDIVLLLPVFSHKGVELLHEEITQGPVLSVLCD
jgi:hypothetical protein